MKEITVTINKETGEVIISASGFKGKACQDATKVFEEAIGKVENRQKKPEFYQEEESSEKVTIA